MCNALYGTRGGVTSQTLGCFHFRGSAGRSYMYQTLGLRAQSIRKIKWLYSPEPRRYPSRKTRCQEETFKSTFESSCTRWELDGADIEGHLLQSIAISTYHQTNPLQTCTPAFQQELYLEALFCFSAGHIADCQFRLCFLWTLIHHLCMHKTLGMAYALLPSPPIIFPKANFLHQDMIN